MLEEISTKAAAIAIVVEGRYLAVHDMRALLISSRHKQSEAPLGKRRQKQSRSRKLLSSPTTGTATLTKVPGESSAGAVLSAQFIYFTPPPALHVTLNSIFVYMWLNGRKRGSELKIDEALPFMGPMRE